MSSKSPTLIDNRKQSVRFKINKNELNSSSSHQLKGINTNLTIAKENNFNTRYTEYVQRVQEVNKAKDMLKTNKDSMSSEIRNKMIKHIKHKMIIIKMIEEELQMEGEIHRQLPKKKQQKDDDNISLAAYLLEVNDL